MASSLKKAIKISQKNLLGIQDLSISDINFILEDAKQFISLKNSSFSALGAIIASRYKLAFFVDLKTVITSFCLATFRTMVIM